MSAEKIATWLGILVILCGIVLRFGALEEAKTIGQNERATLTEKCKTLEDRVHALETSRKLEERVAELTTQIATLNVKVDSLVKNGKR